MQRLIIGVITVIVLGACGSGDDDGSADLPAADPAEDTAGQSADEPADEPDEPDDEPADEPDEEPVVDDGDGDDDVVVVDALSDMPSECVDLFRDFLREIEPVVSGVDWQQATFDEMANLGTEFETASQDFDIESERLGCNQFDLADSDASVDEMIEFARTEAPGTVGFFEFLAQVRGLIPDDAAGGGDDATPDPDAPETCDEATAVIEDLAEQYGQLSQVPAGEFLAVSQVTAEITTLCSPAEMSAFFEREDIAAFLGE